jgi:hypothetical protein
MPMDRPYAVNATPAAHPRRSSFSVQIEARARRGIMRFVVEMGGYRDVASDASNLFTSRRAL